MSISYDPAALMIYKFYKISKNKEIASTLLIDKK